MENDNNIEAFLELLRAGLWGKEARLFPYGKVNFNEILQIADEQAVVGLTAAGLDYLVDVKIPQEDVLQFVGTALQIEQRNVEMNKFLALLNNRLWQCKVCGLLVKGQSVAQCYERPLWRTSGDIDLLFDEVNYEKVKTLLIPLADEIQTEDVKKKHQAIIINGFDVELHGKIPFGLSRKADKVLDAVIEDSLKRGGVRVWAINKSDVYLPNEDNDVVLVFTHFLHHFFIEGVGLKQICDWCRMLWHYRSELDLRLLESRIRRMGLMSEWKSFAALAVDYLGMAENVMPFYEKGYEKRASRVLERVMKCGNFGHNNDLNYRYKYFGLKYKVVALWRRIIDFCRLVWIFPVDAQKFFVHYVLLKMK